MFGLAVLCGAGLAGCGEQRSRAGIYMQHLDGGAPGWIAPPAGPPVWSPDGTQLAWCSEEGLTIWHDAERGASLLPDHVVGRPAWSPDGTMIAFASLDQAALRIVTAADLSEVVHVPIASADAASTRLALVTTGAPSWSPDGTVIAFTCQDGAGDEICVVNADGSGRRQLTSLGPQGGPAAYTEEAQTALSNAALPSWSPDGHMLAVAVFAEVKGATAGVYAIQLDPMRSQAISRVTPNSDLIWSSDSQAIFYSADRAGKSEILRVPVSRRPADGQGEVIAQDARNPTLARGDGVLAFERQGTVVVTTANDADEVIAVPGLRLHAATLNPVDDRIAFLATEDPISSYRWGN